MRLKIRRKTATQRRAMGLALRLGVAGALATVAIVGLASCGGSGGGATTSKSADEGAARSGDIPQGGTLRVGLVSAGDTINPFTAINLASWATFTQIYPQLVQYNKHNEIVPDFGQRWRFSDGGRTLTFTTAPNGKWSDGQPLTAEDAAWTISTIVKYQDGPTANFEAGVKNIVSATAPGPNRLVIKFKRATATALSQLQTLWILPKHIWQPQVGRDGNGLREFTNSAPVVSGGSFTLTEWQHEEIALFEKNPGFYGPEPHIDGFGLKAFASPDAELTALQNGELDVALHIEPVSAPTLEGSSQFKVLRESTLLWTTLGFNSNEKNPNKPELRNPKVRLAIAHAIDVPEFLSLIEHGNGIPIATQVPPGPFRDASLKPPAYDPQEAEALLDELGFKRGSDGIRTADGHRMSYTLLTGPGIGNAKRKAELLIKYLKAVGIELTLKLVDNAQYFGAVTGPDWTYMESEMFLDNWTNYPDPNFVLSLTTCEQRGSLSETGYCNPAYDKLFNTQEVTINDDKRKEIVDEMQQILYEQHPYLPLYEEQEVDGWSAAWEGYKPRVGGFLTNLSKQPLEEVHQAAD